MALDTFLVLGLDPNLGRQSGRLHKSGQVCPIPLFHFKRISHNALRFIDETFGPYLTMKTWGISGAI